MKKILTLAVLVLSFGTAQLSHAAGLIGLEFGFNGVPGIGLTYRQASFPVIDLSANFNAAGIGVNAMVDYWVFNRTLVSFVDWYLGVGGYAGIQLGNVSGFDLGLRLPVLGLQFFPFGKQFEIFVEGALAVGVISPAGVGFGLGYQSGIGFRIQL